MSTEQVERLQTACSRLMQQLSDQRRQFERIRRGKDKVISSLRRDHLNYEMVIVRQRRELQTRSGTSSVFGDRSTLSDWTGDRSDA